MILRLWQESDRPFLRTLYLHARRKAWPWLDDSAWQLEDFDSATQDERIWVAEDNGHRIGFASVWVQDNFLHNLFVSPEHQGTGAGKALLEKVQSEFTGTGSLKCLAKNEHAIEFYRRNGWHIEAPGDGPDGEYYLMHFVLKSFPSPKVAG
ncbi:GNAT family N-acetyltransferase [Cedecea neteri]|uniref:GNAT family N-acetyltransferase n=1 Tax=Cedecea neteri TaxID=158822 RepID=UPI0006913B10|nr:GNAT family N-acetyltransferase [Cedecea neteri]